MWVLTAIIVAYIILMVVLVKRQKARKTEQYLILTFADLMIFYGSQSKQVRQFKAQHADPVLLRKCDQLAIEIQTSSKPYIPVED